MSESVQAGSEERPSDRGVRSEDRRNSAGFDVGAFVLRAGAAVGLLLVVGIALGLVGRTGIQLAPLASVLSGLAIVSAMLVVLVTVLAVIGIAIQSVVRNAES